MRASVWTLGCRVNQYESDAIAELLEKDGWQIVKQGEKADAVILNTCTVTGEADRKARQTVRRAATENPEAVIIVTGCFAQNHPEIASTLPNVSAVVGNERKSDIPALLNALIKGQTCPKISWLDVQNAQYDDMTVHAPRRTRSYIKIEDGCDKHCAYCIISAARGRVRSRDPQKILEEVQSLAKEGCKEIILTGIETGSYGKDAKGAFSLGSLVREISTVAGVERIGFGSLDPVSVKDDFLSTVADIPAVMPHFHISLQSGSSSVLARMKRQYNAEQAKNRIKAIQKAFPEVFLTADIICGFPGETEEEFTQTLDFCRETKFLHVHTFPYSVREGTVAATMPDQLPEEIKHERVAKLTEVVAEGKKILLTDYVTAHREKPIYLLLEEIKNGVWRGHSEHFAEIHIPVADYEIGDILPVRLTHTDGETCFGEIIKSP